MRPPIFGKFKNNEDGQIIAEYVSILAAICIAVLVLNFLIGGPVLEKLSKGLSDRLLIVSTIIGLPL